MLLLFSISLFILTYHTPLNWFQSLPSTRGISIGAQGQCAAWSKTPQNNSFQSFLLTSSYQIEIVEYLLEKELVFRYSIFEESAHVNACFGINIGVLNTKRSNGRYWWQPPRHLRCGTGAQSEVKNNKQFPAFTEVHRSVLTTKYSVRIYTVCIHSLHVA